MPTQTPASRKFVPPSSTNPTSSARPGFSSRFIRPSQTSSSPYARTPVTRPPRASRSEDIVDEESDYEGDEQRPSTASALARQEKRAQFVSDLQISSDEVPDDTIEPYASTTNTTLAGYSSHSKPKRRKISHIVSDAFEIIDDDFQSPSPPLSPQLGHSRNSFQQHGAVEIPRSSPDTAIEGDDKPGTEFQTMRRNDGSSSPHSLDISPAKDFQTPKTRTSRFRDPASQLVHPSYHATQYLPLPSFQSRLLASTTRSGPHLRGPHPSIDFTLPDAFSPSRKRGAHEYVRGGNAETVRGWILDAAATATGSPVKTQAQTQIQISTDAHKQVAEMPQTQNMDVTVAEIHLRDPSGRFAIVSTKGKDTVRSKRSEDESLWMLVKSDSQIHRHPDLQSSSCSSFDLLQTGTKIAIKGGNATRWEVDLQVKDQEVGGMDLMRHARPCRVAVLWDVLT